MQINMKKDRELLGLPPKNRYRFPRSFKLIIGALAVLLISSGIGQLIGTQSTLIMQSIVSNDYQIIMASSNPKKILPLLQSMRTRALQGSSEERLLYSFACIHAANVMPRQRAWLEEGLFQIDIAIQSGIQNPEMLPYAIMQRASVLLELGRDKEALSEIKKLNKDKSINEILNTDPNTVEGGANYYNTYAFILASSNDDNIKDAELALKLIKKVILLPYGRNSAYLDTLAEAYFRLGMKEEAINAQRFALAKSDYSNLWYLTDHFAKYTAK